MDFIVYDARNENGRLHKGGRSTGRDRKAGGGARKGDRLLSAAMAAAGTTWDAVSGKAKAKAPDPIEEVVKAALRGAAKYLVAYNGSIVATFAHEDDALLFESELADIDEAHGVRNARCEVLDRKGRRVGGYFITAGTLSVFLKDADAERKYGKATRRDS